MFPFWAFLQNCHYMWGLLGYFGRYILKVVLWKYTSRHVHLSLSIFLDISYSEGLGIVCTCQTISLNENELANNSEKVSFSSLSLQMTWNHYNWTINCNVCTFRESVFQVLSLSSSSRCKLFALIYWVRFHQDTHKQYDK